MPETTRTGIPLGSDQIDGRARRWIPAAPDGRARRIGEAQHVDFVLRPERGSDETRPGTAAQDHTRRTGIGSAQVHLVGGAQCCGEAEGLRERLGAPEVWFLELQPGDVGDLDHRIARPSGVLTTAGALLAVQVIVGADGVAHAHLLT